MASFLKILNLNKIGFVIMLMLAVLAMLCTLFFAWQGGIKSYKIILLRTTVSFALFTIIGYFVALYFEKLFLADKILNDQKQENQTEPLSSVAEQAVTDDEKLNDEKAQSENLNLEDDSFDKVVIVNKDSDS